jgi:hypothetical protein
MAFGLSLLAGFTPALFIQRHKAGVPCSTPAKMPEPTASPPPRKLLAVSFATKL